MNDNKSVLIFRKEGLFPDLVCILLTIKIFVLFGLVTVCPRLLELHITREKIEYDHSNAGQQFYHIFIK